MRATLVTGRSLGQGLGLELGKFSETYYRSATTSEMNPEDMKKLGLGAGDLIKIMTDYGSVTVRAVEALEEVPSGVIFIPYGPWINLIVRAETHGTGMPSFKGIEVEAEAAEVSNILSAEGLMEHVSR
ncbi:MAG: protein fwdD [Candidatus Bathyarchaeota archaeon]|nr:protein fwdD [Candidatus Bathyarchaeota archaeon]